MHYLLCCRFIVITDHESSHVKMISYCLDLDTLLGRTYYSSMSALSFHWTPLFAAGCSMKLTTHQLEAIQVKMTLVRLCASFFWMWMLANVKIWVQQCGICLVIKSLTIQPTSLLEPLLFPNWIWEDLSLDFIMALPTLTSKNSIFVVVDRLSQRAHFIGISNPMSIISVACAFSKHVMKHHEIPRTLVSDKDSIFMSSFWRDLFRIQGTTLKHSSAYHP